MTMGTILMYMVAMFMIGVVGMLGLIWWLWGPTARTIGLAHMFGHRIAQSSKLCSFHKSRRGICGGGEGKKEL